MGIPTVGEKRSLAKVVSDYLKKEDLLLEKIAPSLVLRKAVPAGEVERPLREVAEAFFRYPQLPMLTDTSVITAAVRQGVRDGVFGLRAGECVYFKEDVSAAVLEDGDALLVRPEVAEAAVAQTRATGTEGAPPKPGPALGPAEERGEEPGTGTTTDSVGGGPPPLAPVVHRYRLRAQIPCERISDFMRGVILPLQQAGAQLRLEVVLEAESATGISKQVLDDRISETLRQIDASVSDSRSD
jgi:hypothetical protein